MPRKPLGSLDKPEAPPDWCGTLGYPPQRDLCPPDTHGVWNEGSGSWIPSFIRALFAWGNGKDHGAWTYFENSVTGERRAHRRSTWIGGPRDEVWLAGGEYPPGEVPRLRPPPPAPLRPGQSIFPHFNVRSLRQGAHHTDRSLEEHPIMPQDTEKKDEVVNVTTFKSPYGHGDRVWVGDDHETSAVVTGHMFKPGGDMVEVTWMHNGTLQCVWVSPIVLGGR